MLKPTIFEDLKTIEYKKAWDYQEKLFNQNVEIKKNNNLNPKETELPQNYLLFCEHPHVYTLGKSGSEQNLLINYIQLKAKKASFIRTNRGGDITYHGPGQVVGYPIFDLEQFNIGLKQYIYLLEEAIIEALKDYAILGERLEGATGVWLDTNDPKNTRKICSIGVRSSRWITMHGFALNVNTDLEYFNHINPCGYTDKKITSIEKETGEKQSFDSAKRIVKNKLAEVFSLDFERYE